jgi:hypothetical protein
MKMSLNKDDAKKIATKLRANIVKRRRGHDLAEVWVDGLWIASFGIRRGSRRDQGHDHIPNELHISAKDARNLALCPMSRDDWLEKMEDKGLLPSRT